MYLESFAHSAPEWHGQVRALPSGGQSMPVENSYTDTANEV